MTTFPNEFIVPTCPARERPNRLGGPKETCSFEHGHTGRHSFEIMSAPIGPENISVRTGCLMAITLVAAGGVAVVMLAMTTAHG